VSDAPFVTEAKMVYRQSSGMICALLGLLLSFRDDAEHVFNPKVVEDERDVLTEWVKSILVLQLCWNGDVQNLTRFSTLRLFPSTFEPKAKHVLDILYYTIHNPGLLSSLLLEPLQAPSPFIEPAASVPADL
jgi:hypothetical protein